MNLQVYLSQSIVYTPPLHARPWAKYNYLTQPHPKACPKKWFNLGSEIARGLQDIGVDAGHLSAEPANHRLAYEDYH